MQERRGLCSRDESTAEATSEAAPEPTPLPTAESASDPTGSADPSVENNPIVSGVGRGILLGPKANLKGHDLSGFNLVDNAAGLSLVGVKSGGTTTNAETKLPDGWAGWNGYLLGQEAKLTADADLSRIDPNNKNVELSFRGDELNFEGMHAKAADCSNWTIQSFNLNMSNAYLKGADFEEITLESGRREITFEQANLVRASFKNAKSIIGTGFNPIYMAGADLRHASFKNASNIAFAEFGPSGSIVDPIITKMDHVDFRGANIRETNFGGVVSRMRRVAGASLRNADFSNPAKDEKIRIRNTDFFNADLTNANFSDANLIGVDFTDAILDGAVFDGASFENVICPNGANSEGLPCSPDTYI